MGAYALGLVGGPAASPAAEPLLVGPDGKLAGKPTFRLLVQRLTRNVADDGDPAWSPDGKSIAFSSNRDGGQALYVADLTKEGEAVRLATSGPARSPAWSPDGGRLVYMCERNGQSDICVIDRDGTGERVVAGEPEDEIDPGVVARRHAHRL